MNLNQICIPKGKEIKSLADLTSIERALALSSVKYNTTLKADAETVYLAPEVIADAVLMVGCVIDQVCALPTALTATEYIFRTSCKLCLPDLKPNERKAFGISTGANPEPTTALETRYENSFIQNILTSTRKINWLGSTAYVAANLANAALLPNYKLTNGIWTRLAALTPAAPHFVITKNAETTKVLQLTWTQLEVLAVIDGMMALQSPTLRLVTDDMKVVVLTNEMYDRLIYAMKNESFSLCCVGKLASQISGGVEIVTIQYGDLTLIKYDELSAAIRDLALVGTAWNLPNRAILMLGLPIVNYTEQGTFNSKSEPTTGSWEASYGLTTAIVDPYPGDFYVLGY